MKCPLSFFKKVHIQKKKSKVQVIKIYYDNKTIIELKELVEVQIHPLTKEKKNKLKKLTENKIKNTSCSFCLGSFIGTFGAISVK